jgi:hypothetical protein
MEKFEIITVYSHRPHGTLAWALCSHVVSTPTIQDAMAMADDVCACGTEDGWVRSGHPVVRPVRSVAVS